MAQFRRETSFSRQAGDYLRSALKARGITQEQFAECIFVDVRTVRRWIANGVHSMDNFETIVRFFGSSAGDVFTRGEDVSGFFMRILSKSRKRTICVLFFLEKCGNILKVRCEMCRQNGGKDMNRIIGYEKEQSELASLADMLLRCSQFNRMGVRIPRGIVLCGEPGVGKTEMARSISQLHKGIGLVEVRASDYCGTDNVCEVLTQAFEEAKRKAPCVLLLDELDKSSGRLPSFLTEECDDVNKALLHLLEEIKPSDAVLAVVTCNDLNALSRSLLRPGRLDRVLMIDAPDKDTRAKILRYYFGRIRIRKEFDVGEIANGTTGFSGAKLQCLTNECGILAMAKDEPVIDSEDVRKALNKLEFGAAERNIFEDPSSLHRVAVHEAGHVLAALTLTPENIFGASIIPQGASNGHIRFSETEDGVQSVSEVEKEIAVMLAGHVAERVFLGEYIMGSSYDLGMAASRTYHLIAHEAAYGYKGVAAGAATFGLPPRSGLTDRETSEAVERKLREIDAKTEDLLMKNRALFQAVLVSLESKHILSGEELKQIKSTVLTAA